MSSVAIGSRNFWYFFKVKCSKCDSETQPAELIVRNGQLICPSCAQVL